MKKVLLTEKQFNLLNKFFDIKKVNKLKEISKELLKIAIEYDFNTDFGLESYTDENYVYIKVDENLNQAYRRALSSISLIPIDDREDFIKGKTDRLIVCDKEQVMHEGKYIVLDFKDILNTIKGDLDG